MMQPCLIRLHVISLVARGGRSMALTTSDCGGGRFKVKKKVVRKKSTRVRRNAFTFAACEETPSFSLPFRAAFHRPQRGRFSFHRPQHGRFSPCRPRARRRSRSGGRRRRKRSKPPTWRRFRRCVPHPGLKLNIPTLVVLYGLVS